MTISVSCSHLLRASSDGGLGSLVLQVPEQEALDVRDGAALCDGCLGHQLVQLLVIADRMITVRIGSRKCLDSSKSFESQVAYLMEKCLKYLSFN